MGKRIFALCIMVMLTIFCYPSAPAHASAQAGFVAGDCIESTLPADRTVECGTVTVPLYHDNSKPGVVELPVMIVRSETPNDKLPLYLLQGGPGGDTISTFSYTIAKKGSVMPRDRDLIFFEQRGTTFTKPTLDCPELHADEIAYLDKDRSTSESMASYQTAWQACLDRLAKSGVDIAAFNSLANAADVAAVAATFGHSKIDLYGVSYGSLLAQHVVEQFPTLVHAVILDGVVPKDREPNLEYQVSKNDAFANMFADCAASPACAADYPNLQQTYVRLVATLNEKPLLLSLTDIDTQKSYPTRIDGDSFSDILFQLHYDSDLIAYLPMLINQVATGHYDTFRVFAGFNIFNDSLSEGMYNATTCSEEVVPQASDMVQPRNPITPIDADTRANDATWYADTCAAAALPMLDARVNQPFMTDTPTLLLSGRYDPITPASMGDTVVSGLPQATHLVIPSTAHGAFIGNACAAQISAQFLDNPTAPLDTQCVAEQKVTFATPQNLSTTSFPARLINADSSAYTDLIIFGVCALIALAGLILRPLAWLARVIFARQSPTNATRALFATQWLMIVATLGWLGYVTYVCFDLINPDGNYDYHTFFGIPTSYQLATTAYAYIASVIVAIAIAVFAIRTRTTSRWTAFTTSILILNSVVLLVVTRYIGLFGG